MKIKKALLIFGVVAALLLVMLGSKAMASLSDQKQQADQNITNFKKFRSWKDSYLKF